MLKLFLWLRYLRKKKIVYLSIAAVALSVSLLIAVASLFTGFINAFEKSAVETIGDVVLASPIKFTNYQKFIKQLESRVPETVKASTAMLSAQGLLHLGKGNVRAVNIWGIEPVRRADVTGYKRFLLCQKNSPDGPSFKVSDSQEKTGGFVGIAVVTEPNEKTDEYDFDAIRQLIGSEVVLTTGSVTGQSASSQIKRRTLQFTIADIIFTGVYDLDKRFIYLPIEQLQRTLYPEFESAEGGLADQIQIKLADDADPEVALAQIRGVWQVFAADELGWSPYLIGQTDISTARQMQSQYVAELRKQMGVLLLIFGVVDCSTVVLIFCIFYMIVITRQKDIAILKSCGTTSSSIAFIFVGFGATVGLIGSSIGVILGYAITKNINIIEQSIRIIFGLKLWKSSVYMFSRIPNEVNWASALQIVALAVAAAALGALIPAVVAAKTRPVEILRYE